MIATLSGKNTFLLQAEKRRRVEACTATYGALALEQFDAAQSEPQAIYDAITNLPFLVEKKLVVIDQPSVNKQLVEQLPEWLREGHSAIDILIIEPAPDKRTSWYKFLREHTDYSELMPLDERSVRPWLQEFAKEHGTAIDRSAADRLIALVGIDQQLLAQEIRKLATFRDTITAETVDALVEPLPQDTVFSMLDALVAGRQDDVAQLYDTLTRNGIDAAEILGMLGWQLHVLALVKAARGDAAAAGLSPYVVRKNSTLAGRLSRAQLKRLVDETFEAELKIKRDGMDAQLTVAVLLSTLGNLIKTTARG